MPTCFFCGRHDCHGPTCPGVAAYVADRARGDECYFVADGLDRCHARGQFEKYDGTPFCPAHFNQGRRAIRRARLNMAMSISRWVESMTGKSI